MHGQQNIKTCQYIQLYKHFSEDKWSPISMCHAVTKTTEKNEITETKSYSRKANLALSESNVTHTYLLTNPLTLRPSDSLGLLNYGSPFFPI